MRDQDWPLRVQIEQVKRAFTNSPLGCWWTVAGESGQLCEGSEGLGISRGRTEGRLQTRMGMGANGRQLHLYGGPCLNFILAEMGNHERLRHKIVELTSALESFCLVHLAFLFWLPLVVNVSSGCNKMNPVITGLQRLHPSAEGPSSLLTERCPSEILLNTFSLDIRSSVSINISQLSWSWW